MKIRYYLRGLGLGIFVTAVFFLLSGDSGQTMSDEMIKERAKELGMIENTVLADIGDVKPEETSLGVDDTDDTELESSELDTTEEAHTESMESEEESGTVKTVEETETVTDESVTENSVTEESSIEESREEISETEEITTSSEETGEDVQDKPTGAVISIIVNKGEGSDTVSQRLFEAGLVNDPYEYDRYLMQNGYDKRIGAGEHLIPVDAQWQEIAELLCS